MELYIMRHSIANAFGTDGRDETRTLTTEGLERVKQVASGLKVLDVMPDLVLASPYTRTMETAGTLVKLLGLSPSMVVPTQELISGDPETFISLLNQKYLQHQRIFAVGHEPHLNNLVGVLTANDASLGIDIGRASVTCVSFGYGITPGNGNLKWKMAARHLGLIGANGTA